MPRGKRDGDSKKLPSKRTQSKSNTSAKSEARDRTARRTHDASRDRQTQLAVQASDKLYYRIGEVSELTDVKAHVLRYWETEFRWMAPPKSRSKQRLYRQRDIEFVLLLKRLLWDERYTIAGARQRIQELGVEGALAMLSEPTKPTKPRTADGTTDVSASADWAAVCIAIDEMSGDLITLRDGLQASA